MEAPIAAAGTVLLVFGLLFLTGVVFWAWTLVDLLRRPTAQWEVSGQNKTVWLVVVAVLGVPGSLLYLFLARPDLLRLQAAASVDFDPTAFGVSPQGVQYGDGGFGTPAI